MSHWGILWLSILVVATSDGDDKRPKTEVMLNAASLQSMIRVGMEVQVVHSIISGQVRPDFHSLVLGERAWLTELVL